MSRLPFDLRLRQSAVIRLPRREIYGSGAKKAFQKRRDAASVRMSIDQLTRANNDEMTGHVGELVQLFRTNDPWCVRLARRFLTRDNDVRRIEFTTHGIEHR